ncbi:EF-P lysine aminoacylase EpmA [Atopomonas sediminilitoris]|uniref:EF-P lysine aminoacylase EpmA n=1 Tax=Atopomonas sediminilitoris TaxID=2919919 RepID=UPI001F4D4125|nr:EF-P lysine aminoacylase EpmA [Atopomonas sediminilitoris]MCJ8170262.1 EF-P lysine aminoacylase EpmA [Atopomonas sediminilitoris]
MSAWQPTATRTQLQRRAELLAYIRGFFSARDVLEVDTPALSAVPVSDPLLTPFATQFVPEGGGTAQHLYLQTSPEYPMKRLLAAGVGPIWQLCKVFRNGESGRRHNPEFSMLEWYRPGFDCAQLMDEVEALVLPLLPASAVARLSYARLFADKLDLDVFSASVEQLAACARQHVAFVGELSRDGWLHLLFSHVLEPDLQQPTFVYDFPASQAALARVIEDEQGRPVAARFELFVAGVELANGYWELSDAREQAARFAADRAEQQALGQTPRAPDEHLLQALEHGLPDCAGVALGFERLHMLSAGLTHIDQVLAFPLARA